MISKQIRSSKTRSGNIEKIISIERHSRTIAGGRIMSISAVAVVGNGKDRVGYGRGKALSVVGATTKAINDATKNMKPARFNIKNKTIFYEDTVSYNATTLYIKPTRDTGVIASNTIKSVCMAAGIEHLVCKIHGSSNKAIVIKTFVDFLHSALSPQYFAKKRHIDLATLYDI